MPDPKPVKWSTIVAKARSDAAFKQKLLNDPRAAIEEISGVSLPDDITFHVHQQSPTEVHLVLPLYASDNADKGDKDKAVFIEPDDGSNDAVFIEPDDSARDGVFIEQDDDGEAK